MPTARSRQCQLANRDREEQRRVADAVRSLTADRDRLAARVAALERNLDEVTGSIPPSTQAARSVPGGAGNPTASISAPATIPAAPSPSASQADGASGNQSRVAAGHLAAGNPSATESVATKTEFGVDIGSNASVDGLRTLWSALKAAQPALFEGLRPVIAVREGQKTGALELQPCGRSASQRQLCGPALRGAWYLGSELPARRVRRAAAGTSISHVGIAVSTNRAQYDTPAGIALSLKS